MKSNCNLISSAEVRLCLVVFPRGKSFSKMPSSLKTNTLILIVGPNVFFMMVEGGINFMVNSCTTLQHLYGGSTVCWGTGLRTGGLPVQAPGTPPPLPEPLQITTEVPLSNVPSPQTLTLAAAHVQPPPPPHPRNPQRHEAVLKTKHLYFHTQFCNGGYFTRTLTPPPSTFSIWGTSSQLALVMTSSSAESSTYKRRKCLVFCQQPRFYGWKWLSALSKVSPTLTRQVEEVQVWTTWHRLPDKFHKVFCEQVWQRGSELIDFFFQRVCLEMMATHVQPAWTGACSCITPMCVQANEDRESGSV